MNPYNQPSPQASFRGQVPVQQQNTGAPRQAPQGVQQPGQPMMPNSGMQNGSSGPQGPPQHFSPNYDPQLAMWMIHKPRNNQSWDEAEPRCQHISVTNINKDLNKIKKKTVSITETLKDIPSESAKRLIDELLEKENRKLQQQRRSLQWVIAGVDLEWKQLDWRRRLLKNITIILKTEPSGLEDLKPAKPPGNSQVHQSVKPNAGPQGMPAQGMNPQAMNPQAMNQQSKNNQAPDVMQFLDRPQAQRHPPMPGPGSGPPPPPMNGAPPVPPPPPPPPPVHPQQHPQHQQHQQHFQQQQKPQHNVQQQQHHMPQHAMPMPGAFSGPVQLPGNMSGQPQARIENLNPRILRKQKSKSYMARQYENESDFSSESEEDDSSLSYSEESVDDQYAYVRTSSRSSSRKKNEKKSRHKIRTPTRGRSRVRVHKHMPQPKIVPVQVQMNKPPIGNYAPSSPKHVPQVYPVHYSPKGSHGNLSHYSPRTSGPELSHPTRNSASIIPPQTPVQGQPEFHIHVNTNGASAQDYDRERDMERQIERERQLERERLQREQHERERRERERHIERERQLNRERELERELREKNHELERERVREREREREKIEQLQRDIQRSEERNSRRESRNHSPPLMNEKVYRHSRRESRNHSPQFMNEKAYRKLESYATAQAMSRGGSSTDNSDIRSFHEGSSSHSIADDSVFSSTHISRPMSEAGMPTNMRSRKLDARRDSGFAQQPMHHNPPLADDFDPRRAKEPIYSNDYPHHPPPRRNPQDDPFHDPFHDPTRRPPPVLRRNSLAQDPNPFHPSYNTRGDPPPFAHPGLRRAQTERVGGGGGAMGGLREQGPPPTAQYAYVNAPAPRPIKDYDPLELRDIADAMEHINHTRRGAYAGQKRRGPMRGLEVDTDEWAEEGYGRGMGRYY